MDLRASKSKDPTTREWRLDAKPAPSRVDYSDSQQAQVPPASPETAETALIFRGTFFPQKSRNGCQFPPQKIDTHTKQTSFFCFLFRNENMFFFWGIFVWQVFLEDFFTYYPISGEEMERKHFVAFKKHSIY